MENKNYSKWEDREVVSLFEFIEKCKQKNIALTKAFNRYSILSGRKGNSVRNYYYVELRELENNKPRRERLNINVRNHTKQQFKEFSKKEEYDLAYYILENKKEGRSVRKSCLKLASNDVGAMIRFQNKFRSLLKQRPELIAGIEKKLNIHKKEDSNIVSFPSEVKKSKGRMTDDEIKSLFMGLVRLVKKNAVNEVSDTLKSECNYANESLRRTLTNMTKKQKTIITLSESNKILNSKVKNLENKLRQMRIASVKGIKKPKTS